MRKRLSIAVVLVVLTAAGGALMTASASGETVLHLVVGPEKKVKIALFDDNQPGLRLGDRIAARGPLFDSTQSIHLGKSYAQCLVHKRIIEPNQGLWNCNYVLRLKNGDVVLQGLDPRGPGEYEMAVLGGTGAYAGAGGDATFTDVGTDANGYTDIVLRLSD